MGVDYLEFIAKLTIFTSIFTVIYLCSYLVWRISRLPNPVQYSPVEILRKPVEYPFKVKLLDESKQKPNVVNVQLTCYKNSGVKLLWGVEMNYLAKLMNSPWRKLHQTLINALEPEGPIEDRKAFLAATELDIKSIMIAEDSDSVDVDCDIFDNNVIINPPESLKWEDLVNKYLYPLVIVILPSVSESELSTTQESIDESIGDQIEGLFVILHIKNATVSVPTTVLAEYVKMNSGHTFMLKPLYVVEDGLPSEDDDEDVNSPTEVNSEAFPGVLCSVCQHLPISRAILPCRHVCLCAFCFDKVDRCPICRGQLSYYFRTRSENYMSNAPSAVPLTKHLTWIQYFSVLSDRLNEFLGFN